jgi:IS5 family transposase
MKPHVKTPSPSDDLFRHKLVNIIDMRHEMVRLSHRIDWLRIESELGVFYSENGRPGNPIRLMVGLNILKHVHGISDDEVCARWRENPYWQYLCGEEYFQHRDPIARSDMSCFRQRIGDEALVLLVEESVRVAVAVKAITPKEMERVVVDTTVQEKAITFSTDSKLRHRAIVKLAWQAKKENLILRQSYVRVAKLKLIQSGRYRHAKQMNRAKKAEKKLQTYLGRLIRDIERKISGDAFLEMNFKESLFKAKKILTQQRTDKNKIYSWHAPEVECIGKGKAHKRWEFGCKASLAVNVNPGAGGHFILHARALHGNPYDGHTLRSALDDVQKITGKRPDRSYTDQGYKGHDEDITQVFQTAQKRGVFGIIKKELKRRAAIEPIIGHAKHDGHLGRNYLRGINGDKVNTILAAVGFNFRQILRFLKFLCLYLRWGFCNIVSNHSHHLAIINPHSPLLTILAFNPLRVLYKQNLKTAF